MMHRFPQIRLITLLMIVAIPFAAFAADSSVGTLRGGGPAMEWDLNVSGHESVRLRATSPSGESFEFLFKNGKSVQLRTSDLGELEEGTYTYELSVNPKVSNDVKAKLEKARAANDDAAAKKIMKDAGISAPKQTGAFTISNGSFVYTDAVENDANDSVSTSSRGSIGNNAARPGNGQIAVNDQVIPDDLIVQGSGCFGFDCVNNESFGFDTIRLKENNLRIKAEDTSVGTFPTNDWELTFNDSASGGSSKFSVTDVTGSKTPMTITAGASTNSIFVDSTGRVGFRTSTPVLDLHVATSNTPAIRLEQNNSGGFTAQTWDIGANEANFFVRDVTSGSRLPFRIRPGAPTSSVDISADGDVGIGTGSPGTNFHVFSSATEDAQIGLGPNPHLATGPGFFFSYSGSGIARGVAVLDTRPDASAVAPNPSIRILTADVQAMIIDNQQFIGLGTTSNPDAPIHYTNGANQARLTTAGAWQDASSREAKENIHDLGAAEALETLRDLKPVHFVYKVLPDDAKVGFIAEDVPEMVATPERQNLSALDIVAVVTKVVQEQQKTIDQLNERIAQLEQERQEKQ